MYSTLSPLQDLQLMYMYNVLYKCYTLSSCPTAEPQHWHGLNKSADRVLDDGSLRLRHPPSPHLSSSYMTPKSWLCQVVKVRPLLADVMMPRVCVCVLQLLGAWLCHV